MPTYTEHFNLTLPAQGEAPSITPINTNMGIIDSELYKVGYIEETKTTTDSVSGKTITWKVRKYHDGRLEADGVVTITSLAITTSWTGGWYRSNTSINWVFPYVLVETPQEPTVRVISSSDLTTNTAPMSTSSVTTSAYNAVMYLAAPDSKTCSSVKFGCHLTGRWANAS